MAHEIISNRCDLVFLFDVRDGNPNGDPDAGNLPRTDPESGHGIVTDVCLKRKVRNYVQEIGGDGRDIFVREREPLNPKIDQAREACGLESGGKAGAKRPAAEVSKMQAWLCGRYYDIRAFGAVLSTGANAGQVRGPVQFTFARSVEPVVPAQHTITRVADVDKEEGEMGRKNTIPYGLYRAHGFVSPHLASGPRGTGFTEDDLELLLDSLGKMFDLDRSAARGEMAARRLIMFRHESKLGNAQAHRLFERVSVERVDAGGAAGPARSFADYRVSVDREDLPTGVEVVEVF